MTSIQEQLEAIHQQITDAVQAVHDAAFCGGDVQAAVIRQQAIEAERVRLEQAYTAQTSEVQQ